MGNRVTMVGIVGGVLATSLGLGTPAVGFAETHTATAQVVIIIPERHPKGPTLTQLAQLPQQPTTATTRAAAIKRTMDRLLEAPAGR